jgi:hypothetical protein
MGYMQQQHVQMDIETDLRFGNGIGISVLIIIFVAAPGSYWNELLIKYYIFINGTYTVLQS